MAENDLNKVSREPLHVLDLPQLYQNPNFLELRNALDSLAIHAQFFDMRTDVPRVEPTGVAEYLRQIIASPLLYLSEDERNTLWESASQRLSERSGRTAAPSMTRSFAIPTATKTEIKVQIHEPTLTNDNLGLKTWGTAYVLAQQLGRFPLSRLTMDGEVVESSHTSNLPAILELGAGTGLVGIAAAAIWRQHVLLTDLPSIVPNLIHNIELNAALLEDAGARASTAVLDWSQPSMITSLSESAHLVDTLANHFRVIIAADPIYDPDHPRMLVATIAHHLHEAQDVLVLVGYPTRQAYAAQVAELQLRLQGVGLVVLEKGTEIGRDDWEDDVEVEWVLWTRSSTST